MGDLNSSYLHSPLRNHQYWNHTLSVWSLWSSDNHRNDHHDHPVRPQPPSCLSPPLGATEAITSPGLHTSIISHTSHFHTLPHITLPCTSPHFPHSSHFAFPHTSLIPQSLKALIIKRSSCLDASSNIWQMFCKASINTCTLASTTFGTLFQILPIFPCQWHDATPVPTPLPKSVFLCP